jgi:hypothetical protein
MYNSHKNISHSQLCFYLFIWRFELQVSACYGRHQAPLENMNIETVLSERGGPPLHNEAKIYSIVYT